MGNELSKLEQEIDSAIAAFVQIGRSLSVICDRKLYREAGFNNLQDYTQARWGLNRDWAYQQINAAKIYGYLEDAGFSPQELPQSESPLRVMKALSPEQCVEIWELALERSPRPTRALIRELVKAA